MKRLFSILFLVLMLCAFLPVLSLAADYTVSSSNQSARQGETFTVPIEISGNKGLMGFRITVKYPEEELKLKNISGGSVTKSGFFNTTIKDYALNEGKFDILWSNNTSVNSDGTLAILSFTVKNDAKDGNFRIELNYSQEDTFDGEFNDVKFSFKPITVSIGQSDATKQQPETTGSNKNSGSEKVSDDYLVNTVQSALDSLGGKELSELNAQQQQQLFEKVNAEIKKYDKGTKQYSDFEKFYKDYGKAAKNEAVKKVMESVDDSVLTEAISSVLEDYGVKKFRDIPAEKQQEAVTKIKEKLAENSADVSGFDNILKEDTAEVIDSLFKQALKQSETGELPNYSKTRIQFNTVIIVVIIILAFAVIALVIWFIYRYKVKRRANDEKS